MSRINSALISAVLTRFLFVFIILMLAVIPYFMKVYDNYQIVKYGTDSILLPLILLAYSACITALFALAILDRLLRNIRKGEIFAVQNIKMIRFVSYLCFLEALAFTVFGFIRPLSLMVAAAAAFLGLIVRVVKNIFEMAAEIKEENEYTI